MFVRLVPRDALVAPVAQFAKNVTQITFFLKQAACVPRDIILMTPLQDSSVRVAYHTAPTAPMTQPVTLATKMQSRSEISV